MLSTADATWDRPLTHTGTLGRFVVAATIGQVGTPGGVQKNKMFSLSNKYQVTHSNTYPSYRQLA